GTAYNMANSGAGAGALGGLASAGFGVMGSAAEGDANRYVAERMGPIAGQITGALSSILNMGGPVGIAAGMFLSGIMGAIASGFGTPVYAEHRNEAIGSIQQMLPVIADALPHIRTEEDFQNLQHAVNTMAQRWTLNSGGISGGYEAGGEIGSQFNPAFSQ